MEDYEQFDQLIQNNYSCISIVTLEENYALDIIRKSARGFERDLWIWSVSEGVRNGLDMFENSPAISDTDKPEAGLAYFARCKPNTICVALDIAEYLKNAKILRSIRELIDKLEKNESTLVLIDSSEKLPEVVKTFSRNFEISFPDEEELKQIIRSTLLRIHRKKPIEVGISQKGLDVIVRNLRGLTRRQAERIISDTVVDDQRFDDNDINIVISSKRRMVQRGGLLEFIQTPLDLSEIGGMNNLKNWLGQRKNSFTSEADKFGLSAPKGVLMLGVQGAGKSLCAKAIATAWRQPLLRLDPGNLYASYIGESEKNLRQALKQTEMMSPVILWIDEIEKAFASAASRSADGGLSQRMFGTLLTWLQEHEAPVFVVATANDIEALPPELLRKGRFDEIFFVGLPKHDVRKQIFEIHLKKRSRDHTKFDLEKLANASEGFSGSEIEQAIISSLHKAFAQGKDVTTEMIVEAIETSPPLSVTMREKVQQLLHWARDRCVPAD